MWLYRNQKSKIVEFELKDDDFLIHLSKENLVTEGKELITKLLVVLQTYKSSGCVERGAKWYNEYSAVDDFFLKVRDIVMAKKKPRRIELNNNLVRYNEKSVAPIYYPECFESIILSFADRYQFNRKLYNQIKGEWDKTKLHLRV